MRTTSILTILSLLTLTSYASPIPSTSEPVDLSARDITIRDSDISNSNFSSGSGNPHHGKIDPPSDEKRSEPVDLSARDITLRDSEITNSDDSNGSGNPHHGGENPSDKRSSEPIEVELIIRDADTSAFSLDSESSYPRQGRRDEGNSECNGSGCPQPSRRDQLSNSTTESTESNGSGNPIHDRPTFDRRGDLSPLRTGGSGTQHLRRDGGDGECSGSGCPHPDRRDELSTASTGSSGSGLPPSRR